LSLKIANFSKGKPMNVLCFQTVEEMTTAEILERLNIHKSFKIQSGTTLRAKDKLSLGKTRVRTLRQCTEQELIYKKNGKIKLQLETGVYIVGDSVYNQRDLYLYYENQAAEEVKKLLAELLTALPLVLTEPDLKLRVQQQQGCFYPEDTALYKEGNLWGPIWEHLGWLIYAVNGAWSRYLSNPLDRRLLRQLRVRLRWLRAVLSFFRPVFKISDCKSWQQKLRASGLDLGSIRELDVMLLSLEKLQQATEEGQAVPDKLHKYFTKRRKLKLVKVKKSNTLPHRTFELASLVIWLQGQPLSPNYVQADFNKVVIKRLKKWGNTLLPSTKNTEVLKDMKKAHGLRIRIKKMRYVLLSMTEFGHGNEKLLRILKKLQDMLGIMHDDYVNGQLVRKLQINGGKAQREEVLLFSGWESAKVESSLSQLEELWQEFGEELEVWKKRLDK